MRRCYIFETLQMCQSFRVMTFRLVCKWVERWGDGGPRTQGEREKRRWMFDGRHMYICHPRPRHIIHPPILSSNCQRWARTPSTSFLSSSLHSVIDFYLTRYDYALIEFIVKSVQPVIAYIRLPFLLFHFQSECLNRFANRIALSCNDSEQHLSHRWFFHL